MTVTAFLTSFLQAVANDGGIILLFVFIGITGWRRVWVWGSELKRADSHLKDQQVQHMGELHAMRDERDQWRRIALYQSGRSQPDRGHPHESRLAPDPSPEGD